MVIDSTETFTAGFWDAMAAGFDGVKSFATAAPDHPVRGGLSESACSAAYPDRLSGVRVKASVTRG